LQVKAAVKATYEQPEHSPTASTPSSAPAKAGGNRNAVQVAANSLVGVACAAVWRALYSGELEGSGGWKEEGQWCVTEYAFGEKRWSRTLVLVAVAFWAGCAGDTVRLRLFFLPPSCSADAVRRCAVCKRGQSEFSSFLSSLSSFLLQRYSLSDSRLTLPTFYPSYAQLGILSSSPPFLLSTFSSTPRGTNGGISPWGTLVSLLGGAFVGSVAVVALLAQGQRAACGEGWAVELVAVGAVAGLGGSMVSCVLSSPDQEANFLYAMTPRSGDCAVLTLFPPSFSPSPFSFSFAGRLPPRLPFPTHLLLALEEARRPPPSLLHLFGRLLRLSGRYNSSSRHRRSRELAEQQWRQRSQYVDCSGRSGVVLSAIE